MKSIFSKTFCKLILAALLLILFWAAAGSNNAFATSSLPTAGFEKALDFEQNRRIDIPYNDTTKLAGDSDFTVSMWIYPRAETGCKTLFRQHGEDDGTLGVWLRYEYDESSQNGFLYVGFNKFSPGVGWQWSWQWGDGIPSDVVKFSINQWTHIALTKSGQSVKTYINGTQSHAFTLDTIRYETPAALVNGDISVGGDTLEGNYFDGRIDEVQFWNTALCQEQIFNWMYREIDGTHPSYDDLVYYYKLNQSNGTTVVNSAGSAEVNDGTAINITDSNWVDSHIRSWTVDAGAILSGKLVGSDIDGSSTDGADWDLTFEIMTQASKGTATITEDNTFTYETDYLEEGIDSFQYRVRDPEDKYSNIQTVYIDIIPARTISGNAGTAGAVMNYSDGSRARIFTADEAGEYSFKVPYNWSGTVTPRKPGYVFAPANTTYTEVLADQTGQNYTATASYMIAPVSDQNMTALIEGYDAGTQETITIHIDKTGAGDLVNLSTALSGANAGDFELTQPMAAELNAETPSTTFTIRARNGLPAGTYSAAVTISAANLEDKTFTVSQRVFGEGTWDPTSQSLNYVDLSNWAKHRDGNWVVETGGRTVRQTQNADPGFFISPDNYINRVITGTIKVETENDDDMIGFVLGYQEPEDEDGNGEYYYDFILCDWKQKRQNDKAGVYEAAAQAAYEGLTLARLTAEMTDGEYYGGLGGYSKYLWFHVEEEGKFDVLSTRYGDGTGWSDPVDEVAKEYIFKILYTRDHIKVIIDDDVIFNVTEIGSFKEGKFGFYNSSQEKVVYGNVQSVDIIPGSTKPVAQGDRYGATKNDTLTVDRFSGILFNDYDPELDMYRIEIVDGPENGTLSSVDYNTGAFVYKPNDDFTGNDCFTYKLVEEKEGGEESETVTVNINIIEGVNQAPTDITISNTLLDESWENGTVVGTLNTFDPDEGDFHDLMLVSNAGGRFGITDNKIFINNSSAIDFGETYNITVRTTDFRGLFFEKVFAIEVPNKVVFIDFDGSILKTEYVADGSSATAPEVSQRDGYTFTGWLPSDFSNITTNIDITAQYEANIDTGYKAEHYKQTVDASGYVLAETEILTGTTDIEIAAVPKVYIGFTENTTHSDRLASGTISGDGSLRLKLYYDRNTYTVRFNSNGGSDTGDITGVRYEELISEPAAPYKEDNIFLGWYKEAGLINPWDFDEDRVTADTWLYAKWIPVTYTIGDVADQTMTVLDANYDTGAQEAKTITITRTGTGELRDLAVALNGAYSEAFIITQPADTTLNDDTPDTVFSIKARDNLDAGIYTATVTISAVKMADKTFTVTQMVKPPAPAGVTAIGGNGQVSISWSTTAGAIEYKIYQSTTPGAYGAEPAATVGSDVRSYTATGLTNGTTYYFVVRSVNAAGESPNSNEVSATPQVPAPGAPVLQTVIAGDGQVSISWSTTPGAIAYKVYQSTTSGTYGAEAIATVGIDTGSYTATGLTNGTTYYFVVRAVNPGGESPNSNEVSAMPQVAAPGAPVLLSAVAGDGQVSITWNTTPGAIAYKIYKSTTPGSYSGAIASVGSDAGSYTATGLINGTTYYFVVRATNPGGDSPNSNEVSATPIKVPGAPTEVSATAGNGEAMVTFTAPTDNGGSPITGYIVTSQPGNITATGTGTTITVTGLTNGTAYTFSVKAVNDAGYSAASAPSNSVTPRSPSDGGDQGSSPTPQDQVLPDEAGIEVLVNGKPVTAATSSITAIDNKTVATVTIDDVIIEEKLQHEGNNAVVTIPVNSEADDIISQLNGQTVKSMENKEAVLEIKTGNVVYTLPASQINIDDVLSELGEQVKLEDTTVCVNISAPSQDVAAIIEDTADEGNYQIVVRPVAFEITCTAGGKTVGISKFSTYVERTVAIPDGIEPDKITTGIIVNEDGTFSHVPTLITVIDGKYYAKINSLTNSTYSVIYNNVEFSDTARHWAKDAANDMGSRLVMNGVGGNDSFKPDSEITRGEFTETLIKALGLMRTGAGKDIFMDVAVDSLYYDAVSAAYEYGIISGYGNGMFRPSDNITREQAITMTARAMKITGLESELETGETDRILGGFSDIKELADYAKVSTASCIKTGNVIGRTVKMLAPKDNLTRAEAAVMVKRLLQLSNLI